MVPRGVVAEFPMADRAALPGRDAEYEFWSTSHWRPLVNGYSGYASERFLDLLDRVAGFPDDSSVSALQALQVEYLVVHESYYPREAFVETATALGARSELQALGRYRDQAGWARLFRLSRR